MREFKWIEFNLQKIAAHSLSKEEVEASFERIKRVEKRDDGTFKMYAETASGRRVIVVWRYDRQEQLPDVFGEAGEPPIFVITAY